MSEQLKPCPHCGGQPTFEYLGWDRDGYFVGAKLSCCADISVGIGWQLAREMQEAQLRVELLEKASAKWNERYVPEPIAAAMTDQMRDHITGMAVSVDVGLDGAGGQEHRYFGTVQEVMDDPGSRHGVILLVHNVESSCQPAMALVDAVALDELRKAKAVWNTRGCHITPADHALSGAIHRLLTGVAPAGQAIEHGPSHDAKTHHPVVDDLVALVRRLVRSLKKADENNDLCEAVAGYLQRSGLDVSPLRQPMGDPAKANDASATVSAVPAVPVGDDEFTDEFEAWWQKEGQYCRAGGGNYERSFAFQAWRHLLNGGAAIRADFVANPEGNSSLRDQVLELMGQYWDLAYREGSTGVNLADDANDVIVEIHRLLPARNRKAHKSEMAPPATTSGQD